MKSHLTSEKATIEKSARQAELLNDIQGAQLTGSWEWEPGTDQYFWTDSMFSLHGLTPSSDGFITIEAAHQMIYPDDFSLMQSYWEVLHNTGLAEARFRIITPEGKIKAIHAQAKVIIGQQEGHLFRGSFQEEKSELHQYLLDEIQKHELRINVLERAEEIAQSATWQINLATYETLYSNNMFRLHGIHPGSINSHPDSFTRFIHPDDKPVVVNAFEKSYQEKIPLHLEYRIIRPDDEERYVKLVSRVIKNEKGEQLLTGTTHDITEKKWLELALERSYDNLMIRNELFQQAEQLGSTGSWQLNLQTLEVYYSDNVYTIHGVKPQSLVASADSFLCFVHPDDRDLVADMHAKVMQGQDVPLTEYRITRADGKSRTLRQITRYSVSDEKLVMGVIQDITEQHTTSTELKEINEKLLVRNESFIQAEKIVSIGNWILNLDTGSLDYSENLHSIYDVKPEALPEKIEDFLKFVYQEDRELFNDLVRRIRAEESVVESQYRIALSGGQIRYLRNRTKLIVSAKGQKIVIGTIQDITREMLLQLQLSERMNFAELLSDSIYDTIIVTDTSNNIMACNKQCEKIHGFKKSEVTGKNIFQVFPQLKTSTMIENIRTAYQGKTIQIAAAKSVLTKGYHDMLIRPLKNKNDQMIGVLMVLHDVTQEHQLQQQLKERVGFIEQLVEASVDRIMVLDNNLNYVIWNKNCEKYYGIKKEDIIGKNVLELFPMFKSDPIYQQCKKALQGETIHIPVKENDTHSYNESYLIPIKNDKGDVSGILWVMHDLTEIMQAREQLIISETRLKAAQKIAHLGSWEYNRATATLTWSDEIFRMYGYEPGSFEPTVDFYITTSHPDHRADIQKLLSITHETYSFTNRIYSLDGRLCHVKTIAHPVADGTDNIVRIIGTMQDITEQVNLHEQLIEKTKTIRGQYELARQAELVRNVSTWQWDKQHNKIFWSENLFRILGYQPYSFEPSIDRLLAMIHPEDKDLVQNSIQTVREIDEGTLPPIEYRVYDKDGKLKYLRSGGRVVKNKNSAYVIGTVNDITEYVLMKQQLARARNLVETITDAGAQAISIYDNKLVCTHWNNAAEKVFGKSKPEAIGKDLFYLIPQLNLEDVKSFAGQFFNDNRLDNSDLYKLELGNMLIEIRLVPNIGNYQPHLLVMATQDCNKASESQKRSQS